MGKKGEKIYEYLQRGFEIVLLNLKNGKDI